MVQEKISKQRTRNSHCLESATNGNERLEIEKRRERNKGRPSERERQASIFKSEKEGRNLERKMKRENAR